MSRAELVHQIFLKKSVLCVGLDPVLDRLPALYSPQPASILKFNKDIIDATQDLCVAYKLNSAFYEVYGAEGWDIMRQTMDYIADDHLIIWDAKRGDIGNTAGRYALAGYDALGADAITVAPYMGQDSISPFLEYENKWVILLALTSNPSSADFEMQSLDLGRTLYEEVIITSLHWKGADRLMYVVGATHPEHLSQIRQLAPKQFLLVPGVGAQGGNLIDVLKAAWIEEGGLLINSSRGIIYAGSNADHPMESVRSAAYTLQQDMARFIDARLS